MMGSPRRRSIEGRPSAAGHRSRPNLEGLESRLLLYATLGGNWVYGSRITYSFVPDGTSIGGTPSSLFQALNARYPTSVWVEEFHEAAAVWQTIANINLVMVTDDGTPMGSTGNQQGDSRFGDIRFGAIPLASGTLGAAYSPPQINGGTLAGDVILNATASWMIDAHFDLKTVAIHEIGHALGMGHSAISQAVMFSYYTTMKQKLDPDDTAGLRSIYGWRVYDYFNRDGRSNSMYWDAVSLDGARNASNQIIIPGLDLTTPGQTAWYWVTVPATNAGRIIFKAQSSTLSLLSPRLTIYDASMNMLQDEKTTNFGDTAVVTLPGVSAGQGYFIRVASTGWGSTGSYGVLVNFGTSPMPVIPPPYTSVAAQPGLGGGLNTMTAFAGAGHEHGEETVTIGGLSGWGDALRMPGTAPVSPRAAAFYAAASAPSGRAAEARLLRSAVADVSAASRPMDVGASPWAPEAGGEAAPQRPARPAAWRALARRRGVAG